MFDSVVSAREVERGKPDPAIFLLAAERLETVPEQCVVIEDGRSGMIGAQAANMKAIGLVTDASDTYPADLIVTSLQQVSVQTINDLIGA